MKRLITAHFLVLCSVHINPQCQGLAAYVTADGPDTTPAQARAGI